MSKWKSNGRDENLIRQAMSLVSGVSPIVEKMRIRKENKLQQLNKDKNERN